jgi:acetyltransferase-like isoleucine patch superfamily enzyme
MLNKLTRTLLRYVRGRELGDLGGIPAQRALWLLLRRGALPLLRGTARRWFLGKVEGPLFIGRGVRILSGSLMSVGRSVFIGDYSYINCYSVGGVKLGHHVTIREFGWLQLTSRLDAPGDRIEIGDGTYIGPRVSLGAAALLRIGCNCQIGANVSFIAESHRFDGAEEINTQGVRRSGITIGNDCWIGNNAIILDGVDVGTGSVIGAGAVVTKSIPARSVAVGVPARVIRKR